MRDEEETSIIVAEQKLFHGKGGQRPQGSEPPYRTFSTLMPPINPSTRTHDAQTSENSRRLMLGLQGPPCHMRLATTAMLALYL